MVDRLLNSFPQDDQLWRIEYIDHLFLGHDDNIYINVYLVKLSTNLHQTTNIADVKFFSNSDIDQIAAYYNSKNQHDNLNTSQIDSLKEEWSEIAQNRAIVYMKLGWAIHLNIGDVYKNGQRQSLYCAHKEFSIKVDGNKANIYPLSREGNANITNEQQSKEWKKILTDDVLFFSDNNIRKGAWVTIFNNVSKYERVVISSWTIFQAFFALHNKFCTHMMMGHIEKLCDVENSGFLVEDPTVFRIILHKEVADKFGPILAKLLADKQATDSLKLMKNHFQKAHDLNSDSHGLRIKCQFPYSNNVNLKVYAKYMNYHEENKSSTWALYVTKILFVESQTEYTGLFCDRKNRNDKHENQPDELKLAFEGTKEKRTKKESDRPTIVETDHPPSNDITAYENESIGCQFELTDFEELGKTEKEAQYYKSAKVNKISGEVDTDSVGVGEPKKNDLYIQPIENNIISESSPPLGLKSVLNVIKIFISLQNNHSDNLTKISCELLPVHNHLIMDGCIVNRFSPFNSKRYKRHLNDQNQLRGFIVAQCLYEGRYIYILDIEPRKSQAFAMALLAVSGFQPIDESSIYKFTKRALMYGSFGGAAEEYAQRGKKFYFCTVQHDRNDDITTSIRLFTRIKELHLNGFFEKT
ncbi:hypothetical protein [Neisseria sp. Ec49-e6-T10]|uniref:hypothetical protein n=1 Tax=Neisseria sp. Ec49-e6-T10 TaxID=3140744 RepID=UPI003EB9F79F